MNGCRLWFNFTLGVESSIDRGPGQSRILSLPTWAGISTLAVAPGCCGFSGPVPSATLDKRCRLQQQRKHNKTKSAVKSELCERTGTLASQQSPGWECRRAALTHWTGGNSLAASRIIAIDSRLAQCSN